MENLVSDKLKKLNVNVNLDLKIKLNTEKLIIYDISNLNKYKDDIDNINGEIWKKVRWYINQYDFFVKEPIINRAFYKFYEMINKFELYKDIMKDDIIFHGAEAPGGFIQASQIYLKNNNISKNDNTYIDDNGFILVNNKKKPKINNIYTMSLNKEIYNSYNLPNYNFL